MGQIIDSMRKICWDIKCIQETRIHTKEDNDWRALRKIVQNWINNHPEPFIDENLALWLDIHQRYTDYKRREGVNRNREMQAYQLMQIWKSTAGSKASYDELYQIIKDKEAVAELIESIEEECGFCKAERDYKCTVDKIFASWSVSLAIHSICKKKGRDINVNHLRKQLEIETFTKLRSELQHSPSRICNFEPSHFDNIVLEELKDSNHDYISFRVKVKRTTFEDELMAEHEKHVLYERERKRRVLYVLQMCRTHGDDSGSRDDFFICVDKVALDNESFHLYDNYKIEKRADHVLYKVSLANFPDL